MDTSDRPTPPEPDDAQQPVTPSPAPTSEATPTPEPPAAAQTEPAGDATAVPEPAPPAEPTPAAAAPPPVAQTDLPSDSTLPTVEPPAVAQTEPPAEEPSAAQPYPAGPQPAYPTYATQPTVEYGYDPAVAVVPVVPYDPANPMQPQHGYYAPPPPPKPAGPPKSVTAATLLNLTGLGLGYGYLRNRILLVIALVVTAGLVTVGFLADAATQPWLWRGVTLGWLVLLALHAAFLARRRQPGPRKPAPIIAGVVAVAVLAGGYVAYGIAGGSVYDAGVTAQRNGDCATATEKFDTLTGPFELTLSSDVLAAADRREECGAYEKAVVAQKRNDYESAITLYHDFDKIYPFSVLKKFVHKNLAETYFAKATSWKPPLSSDLARSSVDVLLMLQRDYADTPTVKQVPKAIADAFAEATKPFADGKFCDSLPALTYFAGLDASSAGDVVGTAIANRGRALYECGLAQLRANDTQAAVTTLETFVTAYPKDGGIGQARAALITAKVAVAAGVQLPVPPPLGNNNPGNIPVTFYNDSSEPLTILVAGPTAHELTLPGCAVCPADYVPGAPEACENFDGRPSVTMLLTPTQYYFTTVRDSAVNAFTDSVTPLVGYEHTQCLYVERR